ncbi:PKD domain-containing protein [Kitasatospora sp. McL0602]|uniref:PKD domain-containing protein n=1 Tax=Kitasatospora sp. McL0602 TaxID=3439530 RepID=UPI003F8C82B8
MRRKILLGVATAALTAGSVTVVQAAHADGSTLYVNNDSQSVRCSDTAAAAGSRETPYCTVTAAVAVAEPGQTVQIAAGVYDGEVDLTRSGAPGRPITITGGTRWGSNQPATYVNYRGAHAFVLDGVHDVLLKALNLTTSSDDIVVSNSSRVTLDGVFTGSNAAPVPAGSRAPSGVLVGAGSDHVTVSRAKIASALGPGVYVSGATATTVTTSLLLGNSGGGVSVADAPGTVVTSNTTFGNCGSGVVLAGASTGSVVENNVFRKDGAVRQGCPPGGPEVSVAAGSTPGSTLDYNVVFPNADLKPYSWGGADYSDPLALASATGQGAHDAQGDPKLNAGGIQPYAPQSGSPALDSADAAAPGELDTDFYGNPRIGVPGQAPTGTGVGYNDRGAVEMQDPFQITSLTPSAASGPAQAPVTFTAAVSNPWNSPVSYTFDFGDGTPTVDSAVPTVTHAFSTAGTYASPKVTAHLPFGAVRSAATNFSVTQPGPIRPAMFVGGGQVSRPLSVYVNLGGTTAPWPIAHALLDFGDGRPPQEAGSDLYADYDYRAPGSYTVTATITDQGGQTATISRPITVGSQFVPVTPVRIVDTRYGIGAPARAVGPDSVVRFKVTGANGVNAARVTAVTLNLTETGATAGGWVAAYPDGTERPTVSNLNFPAGRTVVNQVTVPVSADGYVDLYNRFGNIQLIADLQGYYTPDAYVTGAGYFEANGPKRVVDTRYGTGAPAAKIGPGGSLTVHLGLDDYTTAVLAHVTATNATAETFITAHAAGTALPTVSNLNPSAGSTVSNLVVVPVDSKGNATFYNHSGSTDLIVDLQGWYGTVASPSSSYIAQSPVRVLDTRHDIGTPTAPVGPDSTLRLKIAGTNGVPANAQAVLLNLTGTGATAGTYLTTYGSGARPTTSSLNLLPGTTVANLTLVPLDSDGCINIYNHSGRTDIVADLQGYYA